MAGPWPLKIGDEVKELEWRAGAAPDQAEVRIDGKRYDVRHRFVDDDQVLLQVNGRTVQAFLAGDREGRYVFIAGQVYRVERPGLGRKRRSRTGPAEEPGEVTPPMPAVVVRLLVRGGRDGRQGPGLGGGLGHEDGNDFEGPGGRGGPENQHGPAGQGHAGDRLVEIDEGARP